MTPDELAARVHELALSLPGAYEDRPWGDFPVYKVGDNRLFAWMTRDESGVHVTMKVTPEEREIAFLLLYVTRASHLGRYGWIRATVTDEETLAAALEWLRESYWLKAPKRLRDAAWS